jgi:hypothetical protein
VSHCTWLVSVGFCCFVVVVVPIPIGMRYLSEVVICILLMFNHVKHLSCDCYPFVYLLWINVHSSPFLILKLGLLLLSFKNSLCGL